MPLSLELAAEKTTTGSAHVGPVFKTAIQELEKKME